MSAFLACTLLCVITVGLLLEANRRESRLGEWILKPLASTLMIAAAIANGATGTRFGVAMLVGLILSWWGDVLLIPKAKGYFLGGLVAFLLGHVAYAVAFGLRSASWLYTGIAFLPMMLLALVIRRWLLPSVAAPMKVPVMAYMIVISCMVALSVGTVATLGNVWIVVGAVMFYISDLSVARNRFLSPGWSNKLWGWPLYYGGQLVFAYCAGKP